MRSRPSIWSIGVAVILVLTGCAAAGPDVDPPAAGEDVVRVPADVATITEAADRVAEDGMIIVAAGTYDEQVIIDTPGVTVRGEDRNATIIDGGDVRPYGIVSIADGVRIENLTVTRATFYGVLFTGLHDENGPSARSADGYTSWSPDEFPPLQRFLVDHVTASNNGLYGIYAFNAQHGVIRDSYASGSADSGFYVGQCEQCDILVTGNVAEGNAVGFENANASDSVVIAQNRFTGNRVGMTLLSSYREAFTPQRENTVVGNVVGHSDAPLTPSQADGGFGTGVGIGGGQGNSLERNLILGNPWAGVVLDNSEDLAASGNRFAGNAFESNGVDVANLSAARTPAHDNCADVAGSTSPASLAAQLQACDVSAADAVDALGDAAAPPGLSYRQVAAPPPQPDLPLRGDYPPLPATVAMPDVAGLPIPAPTYLAERTVAG